MAAYRPTDKMAGRRFPSLRFVCTILRLSPSSIALVSLTAIWL